MSEDFYFWNDLVWIKNDLFDILPYDNTSLSYYQMNSAFILI